MSMQIIHLKGETVKKFNFVGDIRYVSKITKYIILTYKRNNNFIMMFRILSTRILPIPQWT